VISGIGFQRGPALAQALQQSRIFTGPCVAVRIADSTSISEAISVPSRSTHNGLADTGSAPSVMAQGSADTDKS